MNTIYKLSNFENIGTGAFILDATVLNSIEYLCDVLGYTSDTKNTYINQYNTASTSTYTHSKKPREREVRYKAKPKDDEWKRPAFKATVFAELDNTKSIIGDIRVLFNKINESNCDEKTEQIVAKIDEIRDTVDFGDDAEMGDRMRQIYEAVYKVATSNKMFSKLYAHVINHINAKYELNNLFEQRVEDYMKSMENIVDVDSNVDYDAFCEFTANNNTRKNITTLLCEMQLASMSQICKTLIERVESGVEQASKLKEVEEITENLVIIFSHNPNLLEEYKPSIAKLASYKAGEKPGLSSRTRFKYSDL
jgi:hypothetical protein